MKIAQLTTYPTIMPRHGGQIRAFFLAHCLRYAGHDVRSLALCEPTHAQTARDDVILNKRDLSALHYSPMLADYATSLLATKEPYFERLAQHLRAFLPDAILLEQPWLFPFVRKLYPDQMPLLLYSAHNIEHPMKAVMLQSVGQSDMEAIAAIEALEAEICAHADATIVCAQHDYEILASMGAKNLVICSNGVDSLRQKPDVEQILQKSLASRSFALFVGSAHVPNALGFWDMLSTNLSYLRPEQFIVVVGSVGRILYQYAPEKESILQLLNEQKIKILGEVSRDVLTTLLVKANVILLPLTLGGGTNLKTAEAIVANRPVVATSLAIRGFEFARNLTNFAIADTQERFIAALQAAFAKTQPPLPKDEQNLRHNLYWGLTLAPLAPLVASLEVPSEPAVPAPPTASKKALSLPHRADSAQPQT